MPCSSMEAKVTMISHKDPPVRDYTRLKAIEIEKVFMLTVLDLDWIFVFDGADILPAGFRVRSHDLYGLLPEIVMQNCGDTFLDKELVGYQTCKLH